MKNTRSYLLILAGVLAFNMSIDWLSAAYNQQNANNNANNANNNYAVLLLNQAKAALTQAEENGLSQEKIKLLIKMCKALKPEVVNVSQITQNSTNKYFAYFVGAVLLATGTLVGATIGSSNFLNFLEKWKEQSIKHAEKQDKIKACYNVCDVKYPEKLPINFPLTDKDGKYQYPVEANMTAYNEYAKKQLPNDQTNKAECQRQCHEDKVK